jgi:hypothetical protein
MEDSQTDLNNISIKIENMLTYWEKRREQEEKEKRDKELKDLVKLNWDEEAEEYDLLSRHIAGVNQLRKNKDKRES